MNTRDITIIAAAVVALNIAALSYVAHRAEVRAKDCEARITSARIEAMQARGYAAAVMAQMDSISAERGRVAAKVDSLEALLDIASRKPVRKAPKDAAGLRRGILEALDAE